VLMLLCFLCCYRFSANKDLYKKRKERKGRNVGELPTSYIRISTRKTDTAITIEKIRDRETDGRTDRQTPDRCFALMAMYTVSVTTEQLRQNSKLDL